MPPKFLRTLLPLALAFASTLIALITQTDTFIIISNVWLATAIILFNTKDSHEF